MTNDFHHVSLQPEPCSVPKANQSKSNCQERRLEPILHQFDVPLNGLERVALKVVESHGRAVLAIERQKTDRARLEWRPVSSFRVSFERAPAIIEKLLELTRTNNG